MGILPVWKYNDPVRQSICAPGVKNTEKKSLYKGHPNNKAIFDLLPERRRR
jgi:hypothetical protein